MSAQLDKAAIDSVATLAKEAAALTIKEIPGDDRHVIIAQNGDWELHDLPPDRREHQVEDLPSFYEAVGFYSAPVVYFNSDRIVAILDDNVRKDCVTLDLHQDARFLELKSLTEGRAFDHKSFLRWLRNSMSGAVDSLFVELIRAVNFTQQSEGSSHIAAGTEKLGKSIVGKVLVQGEVPEYVNLTVPVFSNRGLNHSYPLRLNLEMDIGQQKFIVYAPEPEINRVTLEAESWIGKELRTNLPATTIFCGTP